MSGTSYSNPCPVCGEEMSCYSDYKPLDNVGGECIHCGFCYYTKAEQMSLEEVNERRLEYNENNEDEKPLKPLKQKDLDKYKKDIKNI